MQDAHQSFSYPAYFPLFAPIPEEEMDSHPILPIRKSPGEIAAYSQFSYPVAPSSFPPAPRQPPRWAYQPTEVRDIPLHGPGHYVSPLSSPMELDPYHVPSLASYPSLLGPNKPRGYQFSPPYPAHPNFFGAEPFGNSEMDPFYNQPLSMAPPERKGYKRSGRKKLEGKQPTFLTKLFAEQPQYHHVGLQHSTRLMVDHSVGRRGRSDHYRTAQRARGKGPTAGVPPKPVCQFLPTAKLSVTSRRTSVIRMRALGVSQSSVGGADQTAHPHLRRSSTQEEIIAFKRRVPPRPSQSRSKAQEEGLSPSSESDNEVHSPDTYHQLLAEPNSRPQESFDQSSPDSLEMDPAPLKDRPSLSRNQSFPHLDRHAFLSSMDSPAVDVPQSAPAHTNYFPVNQNFQINQQHVRTRSVQGEPPSATLFSPISPTVKPTWPSQPRDEHQAPVSNIDDGSTWSGRGFANPITETITPASLPTGFGGTPGFMTTNPFSNSLSIVPQSFSALSEEPEQPMTVSPGIYQAGFSLPTNLTNPVYIPVSVSPKTRSVPTRQGRRQTISSSPYSPRMKPHSLTLSGSIRGVLDKKPSIEQFPLGMEDQGLPSASLKGVDERNPFASVLPNENVDMAVDISAANLGYLSDPFASLLHRPPLASSAAGTSRKSPLINVGTHHRTVAIDKLVDRFLESGGTQILKQESYQSRPNPPNISHYVELDFPHRTSIKAQRISRSAKLDPLFSRTPLSSPTKNHTVSQGGTRISSELYTLLPLDLRESNPLERALLPLLKTTEPTLFLAECVFCYMSPEESRDIISWFGERFERCVGVVYEMCGLNDAFGQVMKRNLASRNLSLPGAAPFPTLQSQADRFLDTQLGDGVFAAAGAKSLWEIREVIGAEELQRSVEILRHVQYHGLRTAGYRS
ncbi:hypothetical protein P7C73_g2010, partial [Tremellales sp. Uapishka_1]